jgi:hypothetical protein
MADTNKKPTATTLDFKAILEQATRLKEGEKLPIQDRKYVATVDIENATVTLSMTIPLTDVVKSAKGNNFVIPVANATGVRGGGVAEFYSENGLTCKLFADRVYLSTPELEKDKTAKKVTTSRTAMLEQNVEALTQQNAMLMALLKEKGLLEK